MQQITNAYIVNTNNENIYKKWLEILYPKHHLTDKEIQIASLFIKSYVDKKNDITNNTLLNNYVLSIENKRAIRKAVKLTPTYFQIIMKGLKIKKFIINDKININYIPSFNDEGNIVVAYIIKNEQSK